MTDYNTYTTNVKNLETYYAEYRHLYSDLRKFKKTPRCDNVDRKISDFMGKKVVLDAKISTSNNNINAYYNKTAKDGLFFLFAKMVLFFDTSTGPLMKATEALQKKFNQTLDTIPNLSKINANLTKFTNDLSKIDEQLGQLNEQDLENISRVKTLDSEIKELKRKIHKSKDLIEGLEKNPANADETQKEKDSLIIDQNSLQNLITERDNLAKLGDNLAKLDPLIQSMVMLKREVHSEIEPYCHKNRIPLSNEFEDLENKIKSSKGLMKEVLIKQYNENKAFLERARKIDPYFNFLTEMQEQLSYRLENSKVGVSNSYLEDRKMTEALERKSKIDSFVQLKEDSKTIGDLLKKRIDARTWDLLSKDQKVEIFELLNKSRNKSNSYQINALERKLASYKTIRDKINKQDYDNAIRFGKN